MEMIRVALLTISDSSSKGTRADESGEVLKSLAANLPGTVECSDIVADDVEQIQQRICHYADELHVDLVLTTGGTGISPRDNTPEATQPLLDKELPGLPEAMRIAGMQKTPYAMLTRGVAGIRSGTLIINFPGSPKAVAENFEAIRVVLKHTIEKCQGDSLPCVRIEAGEAAVCKTM
jgi:molybdenum cofactor synthesis domain-containing protein